MAIGPELRPNAHAAAAVQVGDVAWEIVDTPLAASSARRWVGPDRILPRLCVGSAWPKRSLPLARGACKQK